MEIIDKGTDPFISFGHQAKEWALAMLILLA